MARVLGTISEADLAEIKRRGVEPQVAVQAILAEAQRRHPKEPCIVLQRALPGRGFNVVAL